MWNRYLWDVCLRLNTKLLQLYMMAGGVSLSEPVSPSSFYHYQSTESFPTQHVISDMPSDAFYVNIYPPLTVSNKSLRFLRKVQTSLLVQSQENTTVTKTSALLLFILWYIFQKSTQPAHFCESLLWMCRQLSKFIHEIKAAFVKTISLSDLDICNSSHKITLRQSEVRLHQNQCCLFLFLFTFFLFWQINSTDINSVY